ncbi:erythromycin esterase family protein [Paenactinomyces guangxiensis]|uniref:Erythromycin esterase family protein n=1 Tax=Paenactinomyces guangxiensis TaxID=1490290 RepID=A0A7W1WSD4_9BACL|nr:erythromycin esterase family protein [Paenactinomyces guangxiensis]MBA4495207.1 erythromycin esterase family protein [Paenactinomyces guangxiensis]MBH8592291.1 erythromycin esterase family protein [Paenactinomyces guangxiensis]
MFYLVPVQLLLILRTYNIAIEVMLLTKKARWLSIGMVTSFVFTTLLSGNTGFAATVSTKEEPDWSKWLQKHAAPVEKLAPVAGDSYKDLRFLKKALKGKRIVLLGESSHGAAEFDSSKARLVQYLHEKLDYDVIAFESPLGEAYSADLHAAQNPPLQTMKNSIYDVWHTEETLPLFEYLKKEKKTKDPLILSGFDIHPTGIYKNFLKSWFQKESPSMGEKAYQLEIQFQKYFWNESDIVQFHLEKTNMIAAYRELLKFVKDNQTQLSAMYPGHPQAIATTEYVLQDRIDTVEKIMEKKILSRKYLQEGNIEEAAKYAAEASVLRDHAMAKNLTWIADTLYPNKKIIVWGHNYHIRKANTQVDPYGGLYPTMGELLPDRLKKDSYAIGLYMNRGVSADNRTPIPVRYPHPEGSLESILSKSGHENIFVDLLHQKNKKGTSWMFTKRGALYWGADEEQLVPREQYDGILFIDEVHMPDYVDTKGTQAPSQKHTAIHAIPERSLLNSKHSLR